MIIIQVLSLLLALGVVAGTAYWYLMVAGAMLPIRRTKNVSASTRFSVTIPAHNEENVIAATVEKIRDAKYDGLVDVYVVADHCTDQTAARARSAGAAVYERETGPRGSKGAALRWLFTQVFATGNPYDAFVIFDADSKVHPDFFTYMDRRFQSGADAVQGNHVIRNPNDGWFAALTWAMFLIDNRFQNWGRVNLGWSAKNMGDAICFRASIIEKFGWGEGLTEDYAFRQMLLLENIRIAFEPLAKSFGQAPWNWQIAQKQRLRWLRGAQEASQNHRAELWDKGWQTRNSAMIEGALQGFLPSYSTLTLITDLIWLLHLFLIPLGFLNLFILWTILLVLLFIYPFTGLALERAPLKAYFVILTGPVFILWRTWLSLSARLGLKQVTWVRTPHRGEP